MDNCRWTVLPSDENLVREIQRVANLSRPSAVALASHGVTLETIKDFLEPKLSSLVDPYLLPGTREAAVRIWRAIRDGERILVHGDYDVDGITSSVLMCEVLAENGANVESFLPHRIDDGYGLTPESIEKACSEHNSLLITVDCGITSHEAIEVARSRGIDVIVTDHHEPGETTPDATVVIDPCLPGAPDELRELAGVGVAFKVCHAFIKFGREQNLGGFKTDLKDVLDLVALGTVADIVPLLDENRRLVKAGLQALSRQRRPGIRALCELVRLNDEIRSPDIAFRLAPRLNAAGRMGDAALSLDLLQSRSMADAAPLAKRLDDENRRRQDYETLTYEEAKAQIEARESLAADSVLVVANEGWHQGVLGIVASRLVRAYYRPCVVLSKDSAGSFCGSGRSVPGVNLVEMLSKCSELMQRYGGHPMAVGLSIEETNIPSLQACLNQSVSETISPAEMCPQLDISGEATFRELLNGYLGELDLLRPFGQGNPEPIFYTSAVFPDRILPAGTSHTRGNVVDPRGDSIDFIAFGCLPDELPPPPWDLAYRAQINTYRGRSNPQIQILDVRPTS